MAIFSKKDQNEETSEVTTQDTPVVDGGGQPEAEAKVPEMINVGHSGIGNKGLVVPRISEKAGLIGPLKKYLFTVLGPVNKVEVRKAVEQMYGVKVDKVNMVSIKGKKRRYGRVVGQRSGFKKAVVTLTKDSKEINIVEPS
ncbi:MAG: 50S ribosomal protein L23 [Candidatus Doudnabacteria bacterium]